jgi:hypothetical protein
VQVTKAVRPDRVRTVNHLGICCLASVRCPNGDVIRFDAEMVKPFLYSDTNSAAAAPQSNEEIRTESGLINIRSEFKRIEQQVVCGDESFFHFLVLLSTTLGMRVVLPVAL